MLYFCSVPASLLISLTPSPSLWQSGDLPTWVTVSCCCSPQTWWQCHTSSLCFVLTWIIMNGFRWLLRALRNHTLILPVHGCQAWNLYLYETLSSAAIEIQGMSHFSSKERWETKVKNANNDCSTSSKFFECAWLLLFFLQFSWFALFLFKWRVNKHIDLFEETWIYQFAFKIFDQLAHHKTTNGFKVSTKPWNNIICCSLLFTTKFSPAKSPFYHNWFFFL